MTISNAAASTTVSVKVKGSNGCESPADEGSLTVTDTPDVTASNATICEGESINLTSLIINADGGTITFHSTQADANAGTNALSSTASPTAATTTYYVRSAVTINDVICYGTTSLMVKVNPCSRIQLEKLTSGGVDPSKTWSFTLSGGDLSASVTESVSGDTDGVLFDGIILSKNQAYTICETNVASGFTVSLEYYDVVNDAWMPITAYNPDGINGGGDFNQGEALGNYCFNIGKDTGLPLLANTYGTTSTVYLRIRINNIPPPGGNARTPGYWKNWNTCTTGNQAITAAKNGGPEAGLYLLDDHLPLTLWSTTSARFTIYACQVGVLILDERQITGKYLKKSSDAGYKLAKHLMAYLLNKASGTYECTSAAQAAIGAAALLAKYNFNGTANAYITSKISSTDYTRALSLAKTLDAYNNNLTTCTTTMGIATTAISSTSSLYAAENVLKVHPNPFSHKATVEFSFEQANDYVLVLHDMTGRVVKTLGSGKAEAGKRYSIEIDGTSLKEGLYLARITSGTMTETIRIILKR